MTGVSGSGKSTLVDDTLRRALMRKFYGSKERPGAHKEIKNYEGPEKIVVIDQTAIGAHRARTRRHIRGCSTRSAIYLPSSRRRRSAVTSRGGLVST